MNRYTIIVRVNYLILIFLLAGYAQKSKDLWLLMINRQSEEKCDFVQATDSLIQSLIDKTSLDTLIHFVNILSGEDSIMINDSTYLLISRNPLHPHNDLAADFIFQTLNNFGILTCNQIYSSTGRNVYGIKTGTDFPDQKFIICAHYDDSPVQLPAPGADDNASGCAAVLESARLLSQIPTAYTVIFAFWDEEEIGHFGSRYFANQMFESGENIMGVINLDMIAWDGNDDGLADIHTRPIARSAELADLLNELANQHELGINPIIYNPGITASDHASFWNYDYSAILLSQAYSQNDFNPHYQTVNDKIIHFNLNYFHELSRLALAAISSMALNNVGNTIQNQGFISQSDFDLFQNYPNPFNSSTRLKFTLSNLSPIIIEIYNISGQRIKTLLNETMVTGVHEVEFDGSHLPSGVYFYIMQSGEFKAIKKMVLLK